MFNAIASIAGPIIGASMMSGAASDAAGIQAGSTDRGIAETSRQYDTTRADLLKQYDTSRADSAPYRTAGASALTKLAGMIGLPAVNLSASANASNPEEFVKQLYQTYLGRAPEQQGFDEWTNYIRNNPGTPLSTVEQWFAGNDEAKRYAGAHANDASSSASTENAPLTRKFSLNDFWQDPVTQASYQSGLDLGTKALKNAAPLTTGLDSGAALKELTKFGTDYTGNMAAGSQARFVNDQSNTFQKLMALITGGSNATANTTAAGTSTGATLAGAGANASSGISGMLTNMGNAAGAARIAGANAWGGALNNISGWWNQNQMLDKVLNRGGGATPLSNFGYTGMGAGGYQYG